MNMATINARAEGPHASVNGELLPYVTVIMPIIQERNSISRALQAVLKQDYPPDRMEIIVADGMSTDGTREKVEAFRAKHAHLRLIDNPGLIVSTGLNAALLLARGDVIVRVDGHCEIAPDYISKCVEHLQADKVQVVGGPLDTVGETPTARVIAAAMSSAFGVGGAAFRSRKGKTMLTDTVAFPAFTRGIMEEAGFFDEELVRNQDDEYNYRLRKLGAKILLASDVHALYFSRISLSSLWRQYYGYGYWKVRVMQKHTRQMTGRQFVPPSFVLVLIGAGILSPFLLTARLLFLTVSLSYAVANFTASVWVAKNQGWRCLASLPVVFATLHLSYGLGFLNGLLRLVVRSRPYAL